MKYTLIILLLHCAIVINGQQPGVYVKERSHGMIRLDPSPAADMTTKMALEKPTITLYPDGERYWPVLPAGKTEFIICLPDGQPSSMSDAADLVCNYPICYAQSADDFTLIRLFDMKKGHAYRLERKKFLSGSFAPVKEDTIPVIRLPIPDKNAYKIETESILNPGVYGLVYNKPVPYNPVAYIIRIEY